ncbi:MAG: proton-conducting membrane transporter [Clostridia bacterium]|nr:proton-conducting membrane transporter [Clostridia bacterium]
MSVFLVILSILLPLAGALIVKRAGRRGVTAVLALEAVIVVCAALFGESVASIWRFAEGMELMLRTDILSKLFGVLTAVIWLFAGVYAFDYMKGDEHHDRFFKFFLLAESAMMLLIFAGNFMTFFMGFEAMTLLSMPMVIHEQTKEARAAAMKYLGFSVFGASIALIGFFVLSHYGVTTAFTAGGALDMAKVSGNENLLLTIWLIMVIGFGAKAGMFPLHSWLPTAHPVAPSPASAVLSGVITKCGVLAIIRVTFYMFGAEFIRGTWAQTAAIVLALITVFTGSMMALGEKLIKKRLAYSTVSQVSYVLFGLMLMNEQGFNGAILQMVFHMLAKNALFMWAGAIIHETGLTYMDQLRGMGRRMPAAMWGYTIASLSLIGIPPTGGFVSKWALAQGAFGFENFGLGTAGVIVLIISAILTAGYLLPTMAAAFFPGRENYFTPMEKHEPHKGMLVPILVLAVLTIVLGVFPNIVTDAVAPVAALLFGGEAAI